MSVYTVEQINTYLKNVINELPYLDRVYISGEISNVGMKNGIMYFTLKDDTAKGRGSQLRCIMFSSDNMKLKFDVENGMKVICFGKIDLYVAGGYHQLIVRDIQPEGKGALTLAFEQLQAKLEKEGLFSEAHKKPLPKYPLKIGVATSNSGAAVEDIKNILARRFPLCEVVIAPTIVQGEYAAADIVKSISLLDSIPDIDLIIVGRGGGSIEDLWAFNEEAVARAVYNCKTPVISAVGHETDTTICDYVSDRRAPTPSAAAELAVPDMFAELNTVSAIQQSIRDKTLNKITACENRVKTLYEGSALKSFDKFIYDVEERIDVYNEKMKASLESVILKKENLLRSSASALNALSPLAVLSRGYSIVSDSKGVIKSASSLAVGDDVSIRLSDGSANAKITEVKTNE